MTGEKVVKEDNSPPQESTPANDSVLNKYVVAGDVANSVLLQLIEKCVAGASCRQLCTLGDSLILEATGKIFKKNKSLKKGIAFPTCISVNHCVCHFSPLLSDPDETLKDGDMVKIDFGVFIDGYIGGIAHTLVVGASEENPVTGVKADILKAAHTAEEAILRTIKTDNTNKDVTKVCHDVLSAFNCKGLEDMMCFRVSRNCPEDEKKIVLWPGDQTIKEYAEEKFELFEVYVVDVFATAAESNKPKQRDTRTTIYKQTDSSYNLKLKTSKELMRQVTTHSYHMAFNLRSMENENKARMGIKECVEHSVMVPYPVLYVKEGEYVAHFKFTVILTPTGLLRTTNHPSNDKLIMSDKAITDEAILKLLAEPYGKQKKKQNIASN